LCPLCAPIKLRCVGRTISHVADIELVPFVLPQLSPIPTAPALVIRPGAKMA
jgi:hypothetical protein